MKWQAAQGHNKKAMEEIHSKRYPSQPDKRPKQKTFGSKHPMYLLREQ